MAITEQAGAGKHYAELLDSLSKSPSLSRSPALRKLLLYLWEHRESKDLSEYAIALDVFGKRPDFDPRIDATVRVQVSRLRQKLKEHYEKEGHSDPLRLAIPPGGHRLDIEEAPAAPAPPASIPWPRIAALACALVIAWLAWSNISLRQELSRQQAAETLPPLWQSILKPSRLTRIIYPIPVFFNWDRLRIRDVDNNDPEGWKTSPRLAPFVKQLGPPVLSQSYSVSSDTAAAIQLTRFLADRRIPVDVSATAALSLDQFGNDNVIFLGILPTNAALDPFLKNLNFSVNGNSAVISRAPAVGEPREWIPKRDAKQPLTRYGLIAVAPGQTPGSRLLLLIGLDTASLAATLTSPPSLASLTDLWQSHGRPVHFEAVVEAERFESKTRSARIVAFRAIATQTTHN